jgi:hypothetical protein
MFRYLSQRGELKAPSILAPTRLLALQQTSLIRNNPQTRKNSLYTTPMRANVAQQPYLEVCQVVPIESCTYKLVMGSFAGRRRKEAFCFVS